MSLLEDKRIIYPNDDGGVAVVIPAPDSGLTIDEVANKSVPKGRPYKIVDKGFVPHDRTFRSAWVLDMNDPIWPRLEEGMYKVFVKNGKVVRVIGPGELITQGWIDEVDGVVDITLEVLDTLKGVPSVGDTFLTSGDQYSIPPGSFIFENL
jgi:hypothetical protein